MAGFEGGGEGGKKEGVYWEEKDPKSFLFPYRAFLSPAPHPMHFCACKAGWPERGYPPVQVPDQEVLAE